jgi:hypothetical protein
MSSYTQTCTLVHGEDIVHGDLTGVGLISKHSQYLAESNESLADQYFGRWFWKYSPRRIRSIDDRS